MKPLKKQPITISQKMEKGSVDDRFFIPEDQMYKWKYPKGSKKIKRTTIDGYEYMFSKGAISFPDPIDKPFITMLTSEGLVNRSTHVIIDKETKKKRRLTPIECERADGFNDNWTESMPERWRYFTMGNALVVPLITKMGKTLIKMVDEDE